MARTIRSDGQNALCKALVAQRHALKLSQAELASRLKCHQSMIARIESGERRIDVIELIVICRALEIAPSQVIAAVDSVVSFDHRL